MSLCGPDTWVPCMHLHEHGWDTWVPSVCVRMQGWTLESCVCLWLEPGCLGPVCVHGLGTWVLCLRVRVAWMSRFCALVCVHV